MKKQTVMASIPYNFITYWQRRGREVFGKTKLNFEYACGYPMEVSLTYASIRKITWRISDKGWLILSLYSYTEKEGWNNYVLALRRGIYRMSGNNLPFQEKETAQK